MLESFRVTGARAEYKSDNSVVTAVDLAADRLISDALKEVYPGEAILSEELQPESKDPKAGTWVIDPLDGTTNYSLGIPFWGVSIARLVNGWPETAVVYFPVLDELYSAQKGEGAEFNGNPLHVESSMLDRPAAFFACCSRTHRRYFVSVPYKPRIFGCAAYNFCIPSRGIALLACEARAKIWDIAAAWLILLEAGGFIEMLDGKAPFPIQPGTDYRKQNYAVLAAITPQLLSQGREWLQPKSRPSLPKEILE